MNSTLKTSEDVWCEEFFGFVKFLNYLIDLIEVQEFLRKIVSHPEVFPLQNQ
jgi:hypothetical protein